MADSRHRIAWSFRAREDLKRILTRAAADSPINASKLARRIRDRIDALELLPARGRTAPELAEHGLAEVRELLIKPYRLIYRIADNSVFVLAVIDDRRDIEDVLLERLIQEPTHD